MHRLVAGNHLRVEDLIMPYFVIEGRCCKQTIKSMPGISRLSIDNLVRDIEEARGLGIKKFILFGVTEEKDEYAASAYSENSIVQKAIRAIKGNIKGVTVIADVCLCGYTTHGHCRILKSKNRFVPDNSRTLSALAKISVFYANSGADFVAPSAVMPGEVRRIREALDKNGFRKTKILAYSAKFASNFYGPFRDALDSAPKFGNRSSYQLDFRDSKGALARIAQDIKEGADIVMVKPALAYLDIIRQAKEKFNMPLA
ncbi:MAG: porphobilinogen synthase, partial [Candidatus Omnitrophota bacterium]